MHFVDDVDFIAAGNGRILHLFPQIAHLVDAVVGGGVDLGDVEIGRVGERLARFALAAGRAAYGMLAVDGARENFGGARLSRAARPAKEVRVPHAPRFYLIRQNFDDMFLPHQFV